MADIQKIAAGLLLKIIEERGGIETHCKRMMEFPERELSSLSEALFPEIDNDTLHEREPEVIARARIILRDTSKFTANEIMFSRWVLFHLSARFYSSKQG